MGYNISELKAQYYPTDKRICNLFTYIHFPITHKEEELVRGYGRLNTLDIVTAKKSIAEYEEYMKTNVYKFKKDWYKIPSYSTYKFQKDVIKANNKTNDFEYDPFVMQELCGVKGESKEVSIVDLFAGKGEWLTNHIKYRKNSYPFVITLGVELVEGRAKCLKENKVNYCFNSAYEDMDFGTREIISLLLFNPPYSTINGERTTKYYLKDIINKNLLIPNRSFVDFVIREDDFIDCLDLLLDHFSIVEETMFKAPSDEYSKFKQVVFTARYKNDSKPIMDTRFLIENRQELKQSLINKLNNLEEIDITKVSNDTINECRQLFALKFDEQMKSLKIKNNNAKKVSKNNDMAWRWMKELTEINTETLGNLVLPKPPKDGEIVNIISSGLLNQQVGNHVVTGGTEQVTETIKTMVTDDNGKETERIEIRKINKPFFNVLLSDGTIKKLINKQ